MSTMNVIATPLVLPPSEYWDGNDGPWSSFGLQVGTPPQNVRLFPGTSATSGTTVWVVREEGCTPNDPSNCGDLRGFIFHPNESSSWSLQGLSNNGLYDLTAYEENILGYGGNAYYGFDNLTLGWQTDGLPAISHQVIAGYATKDFYIGSLGISPQPMLFTSFNDPQPSVLSTLRNRNLIPGSSWAYTAGAYYREPKVYGSLILGGYDTSRFVRNDIVIPFGSDISRDLLVGIQQITSDAHDIPLLSSGIYAFIDSLVSHIWLPISACSAFEQAFNLTWNDTVELYLLSDEDHARLLDINANITITIGPNAAGNDYIDISMPYGAFDLIASSPIVESPTRYFPLKRAQNDTQYTLGRVFLQQAYVIADYDRSSFSVSQALFPVGDTEEHILPTLPPGPSPDQQHQSIAKKAIIATTCSIVILLIAALGIFCFLKRKRRSQPSEPLIETSKKDETLRFEKPELDHTSTQILQLETPEMPELEATERVELSSGPACGLEDNNGDRVEVETPNPTHGRQELADSILVGRELPAELPHGQ